MEDNKLDHRNVEKKLDEQSQGEQSPEVRKKAFFERFIKMYKNIFKRTVTTATTRTPYCKHKIASCYMHALEGFLRDFIYGAFVKGSITLLLGLLKPKKGLFKVFKSIFGSDTAMFAFFCGAFLGVYRLIICKLRAFRNKEDKLNSMIAGFLASLTLVLDKSKSRRITVAIYSFARSLETFIKILDHNNVVKERKWWPILLMNILQAYIAITWYFDIDGFPNGLNRPIEKITGAKENDYIIIEQVCRKPLKE